MVVHLSAAIRLVRLAPTTLLVPLAAFAASGVALSLDPGLVWSQPSADARSVPTDASFEWADPPFELPEGVEFGYLNVPENRTTEGSGYIEVPVAIMKSRSPNPAPDPLIYLIGGPGVSHLSTVKYGEYIPYLDDRDLVIFEQRGTRYARPYLDCPEWEEASDDSALTFEEAAATCRDRYLEAGIDLDGYRTDEIAADVEDFRRLMGYETYNILSISFGTKVAQVLLRDHPERVRAAILDSTLPLEVSYETEILGNLMESLRMIFADCARDPECGAAFPDLERRFWDTIRELDDEPESFEFEDPETGSKRVETVTGARLVGLLGPGDTSSIPYVPMIADAIARRAFVDFGPYLGDGSGSSGFTMGQRIACWCADEFVFLDEGQLAGEREKYPQLSSRSSYVIPPSVCELMDLTPADADANEPIRTAAPLLLIGGSYDPNTPSKWARQLLGRAPNAWFFEFPGWGHSPTTNWNIPCAQQVVVDFLRQPGSKPETPCFEDLEPTRFVTQ